MKVTRMQGRRMHAHQRDCVPATVEGYHRVRRARNVRTKSGKAKVPNRQRAGDIDYVIGRVEMIDRDWTNHTRRRLAGA